MKPKEKRGREAERDLWESEVEKIKKVAFAHKTHRSLTQHLYTTLLLVLERL